jgi:hypothetical protein
MLLNNRQIWQISLALAGASAHKIITYRELTKERRQPREANYGFATSGE